MKYTVIKTHACNDGTHYVKIGEAVSTYKGSIYDIKLDINDLYQTLGHLFSRLCGCQYRIDEVE